jgi:ribosomal protein S4
MKDLFFTATSPQHSYKSERFFKLFFKLRKISQFGSRNFQSQFKKMLILKKFFMWYYYISTVRFFRKIFTKFFLKKRFTFRYLLSFFHLLERNLLVLLVRANFCRNLLQSLYFIRGGLIWVNGLRFKQSFLTTYLGDCIELYDYFLIVLNQKYHRQFLRLRVFRLGYFQQIPYFGLAHFYYRAKRPKYQQKYYRFEYNFRLPVALFPNNSTKIYFLEKC